MPDRDPTLRIAKSRKMTLRDWPNLGLRQAGIWPGPEKLITVIWCHRQVSLLNSNRGFDENSSLTSSSRACREADIDRNFFK
jgi:hypothetical protein